MVLIFAFEKYVFEIMAQSYGSIFRRLAYYAMSTSAKGRQTSAASLKLEKTRVFIYSFAVGLFVCW
ncbi:MAG: hypothetical protein LBQ28_05435 [Prevotellaceae bacterium]|nr:hypothetical protein [Prevotellaceae bacterium]